MDIDSLKESFDQIAEKREVSSSKVFAVVDQVADEIEKASEKLRSASRDIEQRTVLSNLKTRLAEINPANIYDGCQKELNLIVGKYGKLLDKSFNQDISKAYRKLDLDESTLNETLAGHFYQKGQFDLGDCFAGMAAGSQDDGASSLKSSFQELHGMLEAMRARDLGRALAWAAENHDYLVRCESSLELKLHHLQFVEILSQGNRDASIEYARTHLAPMASMHKDEFRKLMGCFLWAGRLDSSPYAEFMSSTHWEKVADELVYQFCSRLGKPHESPLAVVLEAGIQGLPTLLKLSQFMAAKKQDWQTMKQLPVPIELGKEFQFHSVFVCPILREPTTDENPPMLMPCGHVASKQSMVKLSKNSTRPFKCPYCPSETTLPVCRQIHF